jgi:uncharacterized protein (TIGR03083 family)
VTKEELIAAIETAWERLQAALGDLSDEQMTRQPVTGRWTIKDLLAHIAVWESRLVTNLYKVERGVPPEVNITPAQVDRLNEQFYREQKDRPLERVLEDIHAVHLALLNRLESMPDNVLTDPRQFKWMKGQPLGSLVAEDSFEHYREHAEEIEQWKRQQIASRSE